MQLQEIQQKWATDCHIGEDLGGEAARTPMLHSFYLDELITYKLKLTKTVHELAGLRALKGKYYRGEMTAPELAEQGWAQWQYRTLKSDMDALLDADADCQKYLARESYIKTAIYALESILSEIKNRNWNIRANIDWMKFRAGS